jgi:hypothetical protein
MSTGNWEVAEEPVHARFLELAESYRQAAMDFCHRMLSHEGQCTWPNASVVLFLAAHSVELFLKGAVLARSPKTDFGPGHNLHRLHELFQAAFPEPALSLEPFFRTEAPSLNEAELASLLAKEAAQSIQYRYPVDRKGEAWPGYHGFLPRQMFEALEELGEDFHRIRAHC